MSKKQFDYNTKRKYVELINKEGMDYALIEFICEFEDRYLDYKNYTGVKRKCRLPTTNGRGLLKSGLSKYNVGGMKNLKSQTGKAKKPNSGRRKRPSINELNEHDRSFYQEIMEELLEEKGVTYREIQEKLKQKKEKNSSFENHKKACNILKINRTTIYNNYIPLKKSCISPIKRLGVDGLIEFMCLKIIDSDYTIGRKKLFEFYKQNCLDPVTTYVFRVHYEAMGYISRAYTRKPNNKPKEAKYKSKGAEDFVNGEFKSDYPGEILHADIKYIFFGNTGGYLHAIIETYSNSIVAGSLAKNRTALMTISLYEQAIIKTGRTPRIFHTDHGVEYANYLFKNYLSEHGVIQSMSLKGSPLSNRPSEYGFAQIQREKLDFYDYKNGEYEQVYNMIDEYVWGYDTGRPQSNLKYKTPQEAGANYEVCV